MPFRDDFPILNGGRIYLDNAATLQMPAPVLEAVNELYQSYNGNVHRGSHFFGRETSERLETARARVQSFIHAKRKEEIIFTSGTTGSVNLLAQIYMEQLLTHGDEVITTELEHHSNYLPWVEACRKSGAVLRVVPMDEHGELRFDIYRELLSDKTKLVALGWVSNVTGTVNPVKDMIADAHAMGAKVLLDAAQAMLHEAVDVQELDCDFLAFSGHKLGALTGIGVLYGKEGLLEPRSPPWTGGGMVDGVHGITPEYATMPYRFEAGTPNYAGAISLGAALDYIEGHGRAALAEQSRKLLRLTENLLSQESITVMGAPKRRAGAVSFAADGAHAYDLAQLLDAQGIAVRSGHHCAQNAVTHFGHESVVRVSPAFYNTEEEIECFASALYRALQMLR